MHVASDSHVLVRKGCHVQVAGMALEAMKQPVINGYFIAGSLVGPGGAGLIKVQSHWDISTPDIMTNTI